MPYFFSCSQLLAVEQVVDERGHVADIQVANQHRASIPLFQLPDQVFRHYVGGSIHILSETVVVVFLNDQFAIGPDFMEALAVGVRNHAVSIAVDDES